MTTDTDTDTGYDVDYGERGPNYYAAPNPPRPARPARPESVPEPDDWIDYGAPEAPDLSDWDGWDEEEDEGSDGRWARRLLGAGLLVVAGGVAGLLTFTLWGLPALVLAGAGTAASGAVIGAGRAAARGHRTRAQRGPGRLPRAGGARAPRGPRGGGLPRIPGLGGGKSGKSPRGGMPKLGGGKTPRGGTGMPALGGTKGKAGKTPRAGAGGKGRASSPTGGMPRGGGRTATPRGGAPRGSRRAPRATGLGLPRIFGGRGILGPGTGRPPRTTRSGTTAPRGGNQATPPPRRRTWHNPLGLRPVLGSRGRTRRALGHATWYATGLPLWLAARWLVYAPLLTVAYWGVYRPIRWELRKNWRHLRRIGWRIADSRVGQEAADWFAHARTVGIRAGAVALFGMVADWMVRFMDNAGRLVVPDDVEDKTPDPEPEPEHTPAPLPREHPKPFDPYAGKRMPPPDVNTLVDDEQDSDGTQAKPPRRRRKPNQEPPKPADRTGPARPKEGKPTMDVTGAMHPALGRWLEAQNLAIAQFKPGSIPDLNRYLESQPFALEIDAESFGTLAGNLSSTFPGAAPVHSFFIAVGAGMRQQSGNAFALHKAYRAIEADNIARHEAPRVNEHLADFARNMWGGTLPPLPAGGVFHERWALASGAGKQYLAGYYPGLYYPDSAIIDLVWFLAQLPKAFFDMRGYVMDLAKILISQYPNNVLLHSYFEGYANGFLDLHHRAAALATRYGDVNSSDVLRHLQPAFNQEWADAGNKQMTG